MQQWEDQAIILSARPHGESGGIISALCAEQGRQAGYVYGFGAQKNRGLYEPGNLVELQWQGRNESNLGRFDVDLSRNTGARLFDAPLALKAMRSACALCDIALPEREPHPHLYNGLHALFETLEHEFWGAAYVAWEISFLSELGFSLDLTRCAGGGDNNTLYYVSPKTGSAVSLEKGEPYKDKLLLLPDFLKPGGGGGDAVDILKGLQMTGYFLEHWAFDHTSKGIPEARHSLQNAFVKEAA